MSINFLITINELVHMLIRHTN